MKKKSSKLKVTVQKTTVGKKNRFVVKLTAYKNGRQTKTNEVAMYCLLFKPQNGYYSYGYRCVWHKNKRRTNDCVSWFSGKRAMMASFLGHFTTYTKPEMN